MNYIERIQITKKLNAAEGFCSGTSALFMLIALIYAFLRDIGLLPASFTFGASLFTISIVFGFIYFVVYFINEAISGGRSHPYPPHTDWDNENF